MVIKDLPTSDRPREKVLKYGFNKINNSELIAILISSGTKGKSAIDLSYDIIKKFNGLAGLKDLSINELCTVKGISKVKAIHLLAAVEFSRRLNDVVEVNDKIKDALDVYNLVGDYLKDEKQECFVIILLDIKSKLINYQTLFKGGLSSHFIHLRDIYREIVKYNAYKFICVHNHPSGDPLPSKSDYDTTCEIIKSSIFMGVKFEDHVIIGNNCYFSFKESTTIFDQK